MIRTTLFRLSFATIIGGIALFWGGQLPLDGQSSLVSSAEAENRPTIDADELRRCCATDHAPSCSGRCCRGRGRRGGNVLCGSGRGCARMFAGRGRLRQVATVCR